MSRPGKDSDAQLLLRLPQSLKDALQREAAIQGRTLTAEVNLRLKGSLETLPPSYTEGNHTTARGSAPTSKDVGPSEQPLPDTERAMLNVFRRLPPEKQLALLSLFK